MKTPRKHTLSILTTTMAALFASVLHSQAATITWVGGAQQITGDSNVSTAGQSVGAFNVGDAGASSATVNGVNFQGFSVATGATNATQGNFSLTRNGTNVFLSDNSFFGSPSAPFSALSAGYRTILGSATTMAASQSTPAATFDLTMSGLTLGQYYQFQWWTNFSGPGVNLASATSTNGISLVDNTSGLEGGLGQFAIGEFTADSTTQLIRFSPEPPAGPNSFAQLSAFQLRAVPEVSSLFVGLLPFGVLLLGGLVRRRNTAVCQF